MARIRTIKPDFFTSEDIVSLTPLARLLYIALWCEADREGRLVWSPPTFKIRYLPADQCDIEALCSELLSRTLVELYELDRTYAVIPTFHQHQHVNPRETPSKLPSHDASATREARDSDAQVGREGKGRERKEASKPVDKNSESEPKNQWWKSESGIKEKGVELGIPPDRGESWHAYKGRLFDHINGLNARKQH